MGDFGPGGGGMGFASYVGCAPSLLCGASCAAKKAARFHGGVAMSRTSENGNTRAVRLRDWRNLRRFMETETLYFFMEPSVHSFMDVSVPDHPPFGVRIPHRPAVPDVRMQRQAGGAPQGMWHRC